MYMYTSSEWGTFPMLEGGVWGWNGVPFRCLRGGLGSEWGIFSMLMGVWGRNGYLPQPWWPRRFLAVSGGSWRFLGGSFIYV